MALMQIIYVSKAQELVSTTELDAILESAQRHNGAVQVTGMLLYNNGSFMQVLEGEQNAVRETYARVERDPRHSNITLILKEFIAERSFAQWGMGFRRLDADALQQHPAYLPLTKNGFDAAKIGAQPGIALYMLKDFSRR